MSDFNAIAHTAGALVDGKQACTACGLELPPPDFEDEKRHAWDAGERVCIGDLMMPYGVPATMQLDDDEIECAGVVNVGERIDA